MKKVKNKILNDIFKIITFLGSVYFFILFTLIIYFKIDKTLSHNLILAFIISYIIAITIRMIYFKERPEKKKYEGLIPKIIASSFPSFHSINISIIWIVFSIYYKNILLIILLAILTIIIAYSRYHLKKHYPMDIVVGLIIGVLISILINII